VVPKPRRANLLTQLRRTADVLAVMRRIGVYGVAVVALCLTVATATDASARQRPSPKCPPGHSHLIAADAQAQVYEAPERRGLPLAFFGCAYREGKAHFLGILPSGGSPSGFAGTGLYTLAGPIVANDEFSSTSVGPEITRYEYEVVVRNLRNGSVLHRLPTGTPLGLPENGDVGIGKAKAIVVKTDGAVAWIVAVRSTAVEYQVHAVDATGSRVLASGPEIDPSSLALAGSTLYWIQGGEPFSTPLH
jgi:hypothetical protein